jgi:hypothetical protein
MRRTRSRRSALTLMVAAAIGTSAAAHTPYGQWVVYRQKHLLVGAHRGDLRTYELAQAVAAALDDELPEARARVARGPRPQRIASLIGTGQLMTAVLSKPEAEAMAEARSPFEGYEPVPLLQMGSFDDEYTFYAGSHLPDDHAWLVTQALAHVGMIARPEQGRIDLHPGAAAFWRGDPQPA